MLVLSRKVGEQIRIGGDIILTFKGIKGGRVKISVDAPRAVRVVRSELLDRTNTGQGAVSANRESDRVGSYKYVDPAQESPEAPQ